MIMATDHYEQTDTIELKGHCDIDELMTIMEQLCSVHSFDCITFRIRRHMLFWFRVEYVVTLRIEL